MTDIYLFPNMAQIGPGGETVDAADSKSAAARCAGSSPASGTREAAAGLAGLPGQARANRRGFARQLGT